jgi:Domain of unknown function (DUF1877)
MMNRLPPERRKQVEAGRAEFDVSAGQEELRTRIGEARERITALDAIEPTLSLDGTWHILHYLFTGHIGPASAPGDALLTGEALGEDLVYGPVRLHGPSETREFGHFLEKQDLPTLQRRVDLKEMGRLRVYGLPRGPRPGVEYESEVRQVVGRYFPLLRDYVRRMSDKGNGLLLWVS